MKTLQQFPYQQVLVLGLARSGEAAAQLLYDSHIPFKINDITPFEENKIAQHFESLGVEVITGRHPLFVLEGVDLVVKNPGIPYKHELVNEAVKRDITVVTEVELAYYLVDGPIVAITGSNGKTTTTTLVHELLRAGNLNPLIAGNIGKVATQVVREQSNGQPVVMELSSFQLKAVEQFKPDIAVLLNITEAHLDYHETMEDYVQSKLRITENQTDDDLLIYNHDDSVLTKSIQTSHAKSFPFSVSGSYKEGIYVDNGMIYNQGEFIIDTKDISLPGDHNLENVLSSIVVAMEFNIPNETIIRVLKSFTGVKHRLQFVEQVYGRKIYNDSKATNISATIKAINAFKEPIVLMVGGLDRGNEFDELIQNFRNVKYCVAYGQSAKKIQEACERQHYNALSMVENVEQATIKAYENSHSGDVLLFSPACASWDQFKSFEERGDMFLELVHKL
ncbi:UDP-N-acetylmuramoyl-L-alanine--D-glutamate ligase [Tenuibacillus multivorans]|uniref:UDP-N-acetylmuramoylalanine--D-glutamate ligase n=1 Tax=Tenuibacillus multivorans TaxID=237069 RepID=A0A1G9Y6E0_9BACI|nr:UDP-N-acetylmuramoyl-L-alanine--D-glutamate ligase [Tenuibacillus multivorans]GEL75967.1 UDP-N-acetylmuramoylalanine--D-glutamate ligase [Tenuibacillus multivorans]SDN04664.1 UDP-N-acetylmuramoylalanine--D-glutamate ligase [Tenuibacillus multivorans]